jgi:hypothetical protein
MPRLAYYAKLRQPLQRADQQRALVTAAGLFWLITGYLTTPPIGTTPAFTASDVRLVYEDGSVSDAMLENLDASFIAKLELEAAEDIATPRRVA